MSGGAKYVFKVFVNGKFKFVLNLEEKDFVSGCDCVKEQLEVKLGSNAFEIKEVMWDKKIVLVNTSGSA